MNWKPIIEKPKLGTREYGFKKSRPILVWIEDSNMKTVAIGEYSQYNDLPGIFRACGYNGEWNITHWCEITTPGE